jgi:hypothetical protein
VPGIDDGHLRAILDEVPVDVGVLDEVDGVGCVALEPHAIGCTRARG